MRVIFNRKRIEFTTGYRIDVAKWDADKQRVKNGSTNKLRQSAADINAALLGLYSLMQEVFKGFEVRDVLLCCCFSGLRHSDVHNLRKSDIKTNHIEVTTVKTADDLVIELNNHSKAILEKYKDVQFENNMALPVISNQKMNEYIKELGELAEINEPVRETYY